MPSHDMPFDPADYADVESQIGLLNDALVTNDVAFVTAALKTILEARGADTRAIGLDPRLSDVLAVLEALRIDVTATGREQ